MPTRTLDLGKNGTFVFNTIDDYRQWVELEQRQWLWLRDYMRNTFNDYDKTLEALAQDIPATFKSEPKWNDRAAAIKQFYSSRIHHQSPRGVFVEELRKIHRDMAIGALSAFLNTEPNQVSSPIHLTKGVVLATNFEHGEVGHGAAKTSVDSLISDFNAWWSTERDMLSADAQRNSEARRALSEAITRLTNQVSEVEAKARADVAKMQSEAQQAAAAASDGFEHSVASFNRLFGDMQSQLADKMLAVEKTYEEKLALSSSVSYWESKRKQHFWRAVGFGSSFAVCLAVGAVLVHLLVTMADAAGRPFLPEEVDWSKFPLNRVVAVGLMVTVAVWVAKTLARLFFSNLHLYTDADERVVMVTTYLALMKEERALKDDDRKLIIETLFRHASTGIVKDDASPPLLSLLRGGG